MDGLLVINVEAINLGSGEDHRVVDTASVVNGLAGDEVGAGYIERRDRDVKTRHLSSIGKASGVWAADGVRGWAEGCARAVCGELG